MGKGKEEKAVDSIAQAWGDEASQQRWFLLQRIAVEATKNLMDEHDDFWSFYEAITGIRKKIAVHLEQPSVDFFGLLRLPEIPAMTTIAIKHRYRDHFKFCEMLFLESADRVKKGPSHSTYKIGSSPDKHPSLSLVVTDGGVSTEIQYRKDNCFFIVHPHLRPKGDPAYLPLVELYQAIRDGHGDREKNILTFSFYLAHYMLSCRGSAAVTEFIVNAMFEKYGIKATTFGGGHPIDLVALFSDDADSYIASLKKHSCLMPTNKDQLARKLIACVKHLTLEPSAEQVGKSQDQGRAELYLELKKLLDSPKEENPQKICSEIAALISEFLVGSDSAAEVFGGDASIPDDMSLLVISLKALAELQAIETPDESDDSAGAPKPRSPGAGR